MNLRRYRETFDRHRLLLLAPIALAVVVALWSVAGSQKSYESHASLWVDRPPPMPSSVGNSDPALLSPAEEEQALITELLKTRDFTIAVGRGGPLAKYLAAHSGRGWAPFDLISRVRGSGGLDDRILAALDRKHLSVAVAGPQVVQVSYKGATPEVATGTLRSLLTQLELQGSRLARLRGQGAVAYYRADVDAAAAASASARRQIAAYISSRGKVTQSDATLQALRALARRAAARLQRATVNLNLASSALRAPAAVSPVHVIDAPTVPTHATSGRTTAVLAVLAALFGGTLIALLGVIALTPGRLDAPGAAAAVHGSDDPGPAGAGAPGSNGADQHDEAPEPTAKAGAGREASPAPRRAPRARKPAGGKAVSAARSSNGNGSSPTAAERTSNGNGASGKASRAEAGDPT